MRFLRRYCLPALALAAGAAYMAHRPYGIPWVGAGASAALLVMAWRRPRWEDRLWHAAWDAGRGAHAAEIEALIARHGDDLTAATALDLADLGRDIKETP